MVSGAAAAVAVANKHAKIMAKRVIGCSFHYSSRQCYAGLAIFSISSRKVSDASHKWRDAQIANRAEAAIA